MPKSALTLGLPILLTASLGQPPAVGLAGWRADLRFLVGTIKAVHPRPFHRVTEPVFDSAVRALDRRLPKLSNAQAAIGLMRIVALVNDGHTVLDPGGKVFERNRWYPVRIDRFEDGFFVVAAAPAYRDLLGAKVTRVGGTTIEAAWDSLMTLAPGDNPFSRMTRVPLWLMMPELMTALGFGERDRLEVEVEANGQRRTVSVVAAPGQMSFRLVFDDVVAGDSSFGLPDSSASRNEVSFQHRDLPYWFVFDRGSGQLYAQINQVQSSDRAVLLDGDTARVSLPAFGEKILARLDSGGVEKLVIDLRRNGGGDNSLVIAFVQGLAARPRINAKGKLFVLTGRRTYSAAMNFTSLLEERTAAIFVGEPPGGAPAHYGDATPFRLAASGLQFFVSTLHWDLGVSPTDVRETQEPDLPVAPRMADLLAGRDEALAATRAWHPGSTLSEVLLERYRSQGMDSARAAARLAAKAGGPGLWGSRVQQLTKFGYGVVRSARSGADIYRAFELATELYPNSPNAWFELGRVYQFGRRAREASAAFKRAADLRPGHELIRRFSEAASRQARANQAGSGGVR